MKRLLLSALIASACCAAQATPPTPSGQSRAEAKAMALALAAARAQAAATGGAAQATANSAPSTASLNLNGAKIGSDTYNPRQTPPSYAPPADKPPTSCRLTMGAGGADDRVSMSWGFPIGNDAVCLHKKKDVLMKEANLRKPGTFSEEDFLRNDCTIEGMSDTQACKQLARNN